MCLQYECHLCPQERLGSPEQKKEALPFPKTGQSNLNSFVFKGVQPLRSIFYPDIKPRKMAVQKKLRQKPDRIKTWILTEQRKIFLVTGV